VRLLFVLRHPAAVRSLHGVFRLLDRNGHEVRLAFQAAKSGDAHKALQQLAAECSRLTFDRLPRRAGETVGWAQLTKEIRLSSDSFRYLDRRYEAADGLRARGAAKAPPGAVRVAELAARGGPRGVAALDATARWLERSLPAPPHARRFVADQAPDVVVATHLNEWGSPQSDYVRAAKGLGVRTAYLVFSWDNLTNKGLVRDVPDRVLVWNELQKQEAVELQHLPGNRVRLTGAPAYDHWFDWRPGSSRDEFCARMGLEPGRPIVLYVCSAQFVASNEVPFIRDWIGAVRAHGGQLADAGILVRPHPRNTAQWRGVDLGDARATVWPRAGEEPIDAESRQHYFDSIFHAAAVVGINTSAQIEAAIVDRPVHTILAEEFRRTQLGTLHFPYLIAEDFGHLYVARTLSEHAALLAGSLDGDGHRERNERFLRRFVRPFGLHVPAAPKVVEELEATAALPPPAPDHGPAVSPVVRLALAPFASRAARRAAPPARDRPPSLNRVLRAQVRAVASAETVVAGPWLDDEIGELLYWLPFLSWAEATTPGLRERLVVVARPSSLPWYGGIGSARVVHDPGTGSRVEPSSIARHRLELADRHRGFLQRLLRFARLSAPPPAGLELPERFVAVGAGAVADGETVALDGYGPEDALAVLASSRGYVGPYGAAAFLAVLLGLPAVAIAGELDDVARNDIRVATDFLHRPTFGPLQVLGEDEAARADELLLVRAD
jgi:hypothetical protein